MKSVIIDILGRYSDGVLVLIKISLSDKFYDAVLFYNEEEVFIETGEDFIEDNGLIDEHPDYENCLRDLLSKSPSWEEIIEEIEDLEEIIKNNLKNDN